MFKKLLPFIEARKRWFRAPLVVLMACIALALELAHPSFLEKVELTSLDARFHLRGPLPPDPRVVIVAVDDDSVAEVGRWPWSRDTIGHLLERILNEYGARVVAFDIVFSEPQLNPLAESARLIPPTDADSRDLRQRLLEHQRLGDIDGQFAGVLKRFGDRIVLGYFFYPQGASLPEQIRKNSPAGFEDLRPSAIAAHLRGDGMGPISTMAGIEENLPRFMRATQTAGFFNFFPDVDGMVRRVPLLARHDEEVYPNLDLQALRIALGWPELTVRLSELGVEALQLGQKLLPVDMRGEMLLNQYGPAHTFTHIAAADVLAGRVDAETLRDRVVLLGVTAVGLYDYRPSPFDVVFPGVEGHAAAMANILNDEALYRPDVLVALEIVGVFVLALVCGLIALRVQPAVQGAILLGVPIAVAMLAQWLFVTHALWLKMVYLIAGVIITTVPLILLDYLLESRRRQFIHDAFSHYLAPAAVEELERHPERLNLGGEERVMTAMFSDIYNFSTFSETLDAPRLVRFLNMYLTEMSNIVLKYGGTIDKYEGDAIIAFFGAPLLQEDHALRAVRAALEQQDRLAGLRHEWEKQGYPAVHVRLGLDSGRMVVGNMGSSQRMDYTVMGDHVNLASRLEGVNKAYGTPILISQDTYALVKQAIAARFVDRVRVVGRKTPVDIFQPLGEKDVVAAEELRLAHDYEQAWRLMVDREFVAAERLWQALATDFPEDRPVRVMLERVRAYGQQPPSADWDGIFTLETK